jgi:hypothetical protein
LPCIKSAGTKRRKPSWATLAKLDRLAEAEAEQADVGLLGRHAEAEAAWRALVDASDRTDGSTHADTILTREMLAGTLYRLRRLQESAEEWRAVIDLRTASIGAEHTDTKRARDWLAAVQRELEGPDQARPV